MVTKSLLVTAVVVLVAAGAVGAYLAFTPTGPCLPNRASETTTSGLKVSAFGAVTEYALPGSSVWANGIMAAPDGSVWFGEQGVPGVARLVPGSDTLVQYKWACYGAPQNGGPVSDVWNLVSWNGRVWAADGNANRLVGLDPNDGSLTYVNTTSAKFPYLLATAPDGSLWFTSLTSPAMLGRLSPTLGLTVYAVSGLGGEEPIQVQFVNSTYAYMVALNPYADNDSGLYSFDPQVAGGAVAVTKLGAGFQLLFAQALSVGDGRVWIAQHYPSSVVSYDPTTGGWTTYPTSRVSFENTTLPYFIGVQGGMVWFNEHEGNRIAMLNPSSGTLTEYSESDPPAASYNGIQNDLTIATTPAGVWFTSATSNYVGFVNSDLPKNFTISARGADAASVAPGGKVTEGFEVTGSWTVPLSVQVSDSETITAAPENVMLTPSAASIPPSAGIRGPAIFTVSMEVSPSIKPGRYTVAVTVTDGLLSQTAYVFLTVT